MSSVEPLALSALPRVASARRRLTRVPRRWIGWRQTGASVSLPGVGPVRLQWDGFEATEPPSREELSLVGRDGRRGRVVLDRWLALGLVAATLGLQPPRALRRLGPAERGVLAALLASSLAQCGCDLTVTWDEPGGSPAIHVVGFGLRAVGTGIAGLVRLDLPVEWLSAGGSSPPLPVTSVARLGHLPLQISIEIAATTVAAGEWAAARSGDCVLFEGHSYPAADGSPGRDARSIPVAVRVGDYAGDASFDWLASVSAAGAVVFTGPFRAVSPRVANQNPMSSDREPNKQEADAMSPPPHDPKSDQPHVDPNPNADVVGAAPIEVVAEVGRLTLRGDEILGLERGSVLSFARRDHAVDLLVGGRPWARGELVNVDGELGVRITELLRV